MNRSASPGLGQWITVSLMVAITMFLLYKIYEYAGSRSYYPTGLTVAGINVGGLTRAQASEAIANRYIDAPVILYHGNDTIEMSPTRAEFTPDIAAMLSEADYQRSQQDFWAGFWGFLWGRPVEVEPVPFASHAQSGHAAGFFARHCAPGGSTRTATAAGSRHADVPVRHLRDGNRH
jgi:hypothetical protein